MDEQRTEQWFILRAGKITASRVADVMAKTKSGYSASRENYMAQLIVESITGKPTESFTSPAMQWGTEQEPFARAAYEMKADILVTEVGFIHHPNILNCGASPDGLVGDDGLVEIKCPNTATMIDIVLTEKIPSRYFAQMQLQIACTERAWCDFVVYDPRMPEGCQLWSKRVERDDEFIANMEMEIGKFQEEMSEKLFKLNEKLA